MVLFSRHGWEIAGGVAMMTVLVGGAVWLLVRRRPTEQELERARRKQLVQFGRLVDGMLLDLCEVNGKEGDTLKLLLFNYRIGGVDYECSQDITYLQEIVNPAEVRVGFPCTVRYQPGNPQNSIVIAEGWSGLRDALPQLAIRERRESLDPSSLRKQG